MDWMLILAYVTGTVDQQLLKEECLSKVILLGERSLRRALNEYVEHYHAERNHQGKGNVLLFPRETDVRREGPVQYLERLGGLLRLPSRGGVIAHPRFNPGRDRGTARATLGRLGLFRRFRFTCPFSLFHSPRFRTPPRVIPDGRFSRVRLATMTVLAWSSLARRGLSAHSHTPRARQVYRAAR
jgi:hypothetical protein